MRALPAGTSDMLPGLSPISPAPLTVGDTAPLTQIQEAWREGFLETTVTHILDPLYLPLSVLFHLDTNSSVAS